MPSRRNSRSRHSGGGDSLAIPQGLDFLKNAPGKQTGGGCNALHGAPVVGGDSMLLEGGLRETAGVARLDASVGEIRGMSDQAGGRRRKSPKAARKSRKAGRKSLKARKSRKSGRKSPKARKSGRKSLKSRKSERKSLKSRKSGRKSRSSRKSGRKSRSSRKSGRKSRMNGGGHQGSPVNAPAMLLSDYSKTGSGFTGNAFKDGAGSV
jgi:hypothetical protein